MNSIKKSPLSWGLNLGKIIDSKIGNPTITYVQNNESPNWKLLSPILDELVMDNVNELIVNMAEEANITIRTLLLHKPISKDYNNVRIYESKNKDLLKNLPNYKCRIEVASLQELLENNEDFWYIYRQPNLYDFNFNFGKYLKTVEDNQYVINYYKIDKWLYSVYQTK